jgi:hypothetical protein
MRKFKLSAELIFTIVMFIVLFLGFCFVVGFAVHASIVMLDLGWLFYPNR